MLFGAVGGPKWDKLPFDKKPEHGLLRLRSDLGLFANLRPALCFDALKDASTLKPEIVSGLDILIVRELTGGVYFGLPKEITALADGQKRAVDTQVYTTSEIERIARVAFELARLRAKRVASAEKSNVMVTGVLWREVVTRVHDAEFPDVALSHILADNCAMQLVRNPKQFDVIVTDNLFGDVLVGRSGAAHRLDRHAALGLAGRQGCRRPADARSTSRSTARRRTSRARASPIRSPRSCRSPCACAIRSGAARMRRCWKRRSSACWPKAIRTADIMQPGMTKLGTAAMTDAILKALDKLSN